MMGFADKTDESAGKKCIIGKIPVMTQEVPYA